MKLFCAIIALFGILVCPALRIQAQERSIIYFDVADLFEPVRAFGFSMESNRFDLMMFRNTVSGEIQLVHELRSPDGLIWDFWQADERQILSDCGGPTGPRDPVSLCASIWLTPKERSELLAGEWSLREVRTFQGVAQLLESPIVPHDTDQDGVPDFRDLCPQTPAGLVVNADGCSLDQLAPCDGLWRNHGEYVVARKSVISSFAAQGLITKDEERELCRAAAQSECGQEWDGSSEPER